MSGHGWEPGVITVTCEDGCYKLPGWVREPFGIDWGLIKDTFDAPGDIGWTIHHLPTGYGVMATWMDIADVLKLVDLLLTLGDWDFNDPDEVHHFADAVMLARASGFEVFNPKYVRRPAYPDRMTAALA